MFLNKKNIPLNPPLFQGNETITDFKKKAELFKPFFVKQSSQPSFHNLKAFRYPKLL